MAVVTIAAANIPLVQTGDTSLLLRLCCNAPYTTYEGVEILPGTGATGTWFLEYSCTVTSNVAAVPQVTIYATTDRVTGQDPRWSGIFFDPTGTQIRGYLLSSFQVPAVPTSTEWSKLSVYNSLPPQPYINSYYNANQIDALLANKVDGAGTALAYPLWSDANTLQNGYLKQESLAVSLDGAGAGPAFRLYTGGTAGAANYTRAVLKADPNVTELTAEGGGTGAGQVTAVRLNALGTGALIQFYRDGTNLWTINADGNFVPNGVKNIGTDVAPVNSLALSGNLAFYNTGVTQAAISCPAVNTLSFDDSTTGFARLRVGAGVYIQSGAGSPEGVVTANIGSLYSRTDGGASTTLYVKESGVGNTGWRAV